GEDQGEQASEPDYPSAKADIADKRKPLAGKRRRNSWLSVFSLLLGAASGGAWYVLNKMSGSEAHTMLSELLQTRLPQFTEQHQPFLLYGAGAFALLFIIFMIRSAGAGSKVQQLDDELFRLNRRAERARADVDKVSKIREGKLSDALEKIATLENEELAKDAEEFLTDGATDLISTEGWADICRQCEHVLTGLDLVSDRLAPQMEKAEESAKEDYEQACLALEGADAAILEEKSRLDERDGLIRQIESDQAAQTLPRDRIDVRGVAIELITGTVRRIYTHFNLQLREYLGSLLPLFTEGRYQHLKIDDSFAVQVFSLEKNDFVGLDDLSSGTQRQLILAIRLAMSQALVDSRKTGKQTLILDEPFAFFDRDRMQQSLNTFAEFSPEISQIWVISQEFDNLGKFDLIIDCDRDSASLSC
ncbi:MAG: ATP-binding protein, partial [Gammaproteobacteria bacterium]